MRLNCCSDTEGSDPENSTQAGPSTNTNTAAQAQMHGKQRDQRTSSHMTKRLHGSFPDLPSSVPLTFTLTMKACLCEQPCERPSFGQILSLFDDVLTEVNEGHYLNSAGRIQV